MFGFFMTHEYDGVKWLLKSKKRCSFIPSDYFEENENVKTPCRIFVKPLWARNEEHEISRHHVQYHAYGAKYSYSFTTVTCSTPSVRKLDMFILCEGETVTNRTTCRTDSECGETETCRKHIDMDQQICIPTRHLHESCDDSSSCKNSECKGTDRNRSCQCGISHRALNGQIECLKSNLSLGQSCVNDTQCKGTQNAGRCLNGECFCEEGFVLQKLRCLPDMRRLGESCEGHLQCSGTVNAGVCGRYKICTCNQGFLATHGGCLQGNLSLGQTCTHDIQCMGTESGRKFLNGECFCAKGYVLERLRCLPDNRRLGESCEGHLQCSGTVNAGVCGSNKTCTCNQGFLATHGGCLQGNLSLGQTCRHDIQCMGTDHGRKCLKGECFCAEGYVLQRLRCLPGGKRLDEPCDGHLHCSVTLNAGVCGKTKICTCDQGFVRVQGECLKGQTCKYDTQCMGTKNARKCLDGECFCEEGYVLQDLRCLPGNLSPGQTCKHDVQCTATEYNGRCINGKCDCAKGHVLHELSCLPADKEPIDDAYGEHNQKKNETKVSVVCDLNKTLTCNEGCIKIESCKQGNLSLDQSCSHDAQCTSTENGGRCLNGKCFCNEGFALENLRCVPGKRASFISWITEEHGVYLMTGSGVICMIVICSAILVVLNRRKSGKMRAPPTTQHSIAERSLFQNIPNEMQLDSLYSDPIDSQWPWRKEEE
uniref:Tenascin-like isoform X2 n=1 Tax=Crassostrea virginica TaxID=6565 RepID=A0A8B8BD51_CRAVI|nr:tenascin-like isoform X2 [Crassostrea virginica]